PVQRHLRLRRRGPETGGLIEIVEAIEQRAAARLADDRGDVLAVVVVAVDLPVRSAGRSAAVDARAAVGGDAAVGVRAQRASPRIDLEVVEVEEIARAGGTGRALRADHAA